MVWVGAVWVRMCQAGLSIRGTTHSRTQYPVKTTTTTVVPEYATQACDTTQESLSKRLLQLFY
jgi:hypothetical protein